MNYEKPMYSVLIITPKGTKYYVKKMGTSLNSNLLTGLSLSEAKGQIAQKAVVRMFNRSMAGHGYPSSIFSVRSRVFIYAKGGGKSKTTEVFRGYIWSVDHNVGAKGSEVTFTCYNNLIYLMNSETLYYFSKGKTTKEILTTLFKKKGIKYKYNYLSITHPKLPISGSLADVMTSKLLDEVEKKRGTKYVVRGEKDAIVIDKTGSNKSVYRISRGTSGIMINYSKSVTMEGMVTKVIIAGKTDENQKTKVESTVKRNTKTYGTLAKIISKDGDTTEAEIEKEAKSILDDNATPHKNYDITALDIPWIRKGDRISAEFNRGTYHGCIVEEITHNTEDLTMTMSVRVLKK